MTRALIRALRPSTRIRCESHECWQRRSRNIERGWKARVAPRVDKVIADYHGRWSREGYPTQKTYLVIQYWVSFSTESHLLLGNTNLYEAIDVLGWDLSPIARNERVVPRPRPAYMEEGDMPTWQVWNTSVLLFDPDGDVEGGRSVGALER